MSETAKPWYREPWPWILMAGPAIVIVAGAATMTLAFTTKDELVATDYYKRGIEINRELVTPAKAGVQPLDSRLRGNDDK